LNSENHAQRVNGVGGLLPQRLGHGCVIKVVAHLARSGGGGRHDAFLVLADRRWNRGKPDRTLRIRMTLRTGDGARVQRQQFGILVRLADLQVQRPLQRSQWFEAAAMVRAADELNLYRLGSADSSRPP
jgi:hypothetical protein